MSRNRKNNPTSLCEVHHNPVAAGFQTQAPFLTPSSHGDPSRLEFSLPLEPGCAHRPWSNPKYDADPQRLSRPLWAYRWFPIHKPSSNSIVPVVCDTEPSLDSWLLNMYFLTPDFMKQLFSATFQVKQDWTGCSVSRLRKCKNARKCYC